MKTYEEKKRDLYKKMKEYTKKDICIAFSGGVDSSLLLMLARECLQQHKKAGKIHAVTFHTVLHPSCDLEIAQKVAKEAGAVHKVVFAKITSVFRKKFGLILKTDVIFAKKLYSKSLWNMPKVREFLLSWKEQTRTICMCIVRD